MNNKFTAKQEKSESVKLLMVAKIIFVKFCHLLPSGFSCDMNRSYLCPVCHQNHCSGHLMLEMNVLPS